MTYFANCKTLEELKIAYKKLALANHPDLGGDVEKMKLINAEYDEIFPRLKNRHANKDGEIYEKENAEVPDFFKDLISKLIHLDGIEIEIIGTFVWVSGGTKKHRETLKGLGFKWSNTKVMWYKAPADYKKHNKKQFDISEIREMFGSQKVETEKQTLIA